MTRCILVATVVLLTAGRLAAQRPDKGRATELEGRWKLIKRVSDGQELPPQPIINTIRGDTHTISREGKVVSVTRARLDPTKRPKTIDFEVLEGSTTGLQYGRGIYSVDGDELRICVRSGKEWPAESERPTEFVSKSGSRLSLT